MTRVAIALLAVLGGSACAYADFLQLTSVTPGSSGGFTGTLGAVTVTGSISTPAPSGNFDFNGTMGPSAYESSVLNNTSPQYSYANIYTPATPLTDQVGYTSYAGTYNAATVTIKFSAPVTDPIFDIASIDETQLDFTPTPGLLGLLLLSGNGGAGDGIEVTNNTILDADTATFAGQLPSAPPLTTGPRSGYGSVELLGTFTSLTFNDTNPSMGGDGGSFTLATAPEPSTNALCFAGLFALLSGVMFRKSFTA